MCNTKFQHCKHVRRDCSYYLRVHLLDTSCQTALLSIHWTWSSVRNRRSRLRTELHCPTKQICNRGITDLYFSHFSVKFLVEFQKFAVSGNQKFSNRGNSPKWFPKQMRHFLFKSRLTRMKNFKKNQRRFFEKICTFLYDENRRCL